MHFCIKVSGEDFDRGNAQEGERRGNFQTEARRVGVDGCLVAGCCDRPGGVGEVMLHRAAPILKGRVIETLSTRFNSRVEMDGFDVSVVKGLEVSGDGLRIFPEDEVVAAGATEPLIALGHFSFHADWRGCLRSRCMWGRCM